MSDDDDLMAMYEDMDEGIKYTDNRQPRETYTRSLFAYPGGKSKSVQMIRPHLPLYGGYCEPFGGSGALMLARKAVKLEVFNDKFAGVTDFYRCMRDKALTERLVQWLEMTVHSREEWMQCREEWQDATDLVERAARWYYMTVYSFASQGRNFGRACYGNNNMSGKIHNKLNSFHEVHQRFKGVLIENQDWRNILHDFDHHDMVFYMDPPYMTAYKGTYKNELSPEDHKELLDAIFSLKGFVAISGYPNALYESYPWDAKQSWRQNVTIRGGAAREENNKVQAAVDGQDRATEVLWIKESR